MKKSTKTLHWLEGSECREQCPYCINEELEYRFEQRYEGIVIWCEESHIEEISSQYEEMYLDAYALDWQISQGLKSPWF